MTVEQFNSSSLDHRRNLVWTRGRFLLIHQNSICKVVLYGMEGFFAEVWLSPANNGIILINGFDSHQCLDPYLDEIDISELIRVE